MDEALKSKLIYLPKEAVFLFILLWIKLLDLAAGEDEEVEGGDHIDDGGDVVHYLPPGMKNCDGGPPFFLLKMFKN